MTEIEVFKHLAAFVGGFVLLVWICGGDEE